MTQASPAGAIGVLSTTPDWQNTNVIALDAGDKGGCAIQAASATDTSGVLFCWGSATVLGTGANLESNVPVKVSAGAGFLNTAVTAVAVGDEHACAIEAGQLWCWGSAYLNGLYGILGTGLTSSLTPIKVSANEGFDNDGASGDAVTAVDASHSRTCAIEGGRVFCWGHNNSLQLGIGANPSGATNIPRALVDSNPADLLSKTATDLSVGAFHSCAIASGTVFCWGSNSFGELGPGSGSTTQGIPLKVDNGDFTGGNTGVTSLEVGEYFSCAVKSGKAHCWGNGADDRLGNGLTTNRSAPVAVASVSGGFANTSVTAVSAGGKHACAIESGKLYCWGGNSRGELGNGTTTSSNTAVAVSPSEVAGFANNGNVTTVSAATGGGNGHTCAIDNKVAYCWGSGSDSRLGVGNSFSQNKPVKVFVVSVPAIPTNLIVTAGNAQLSVRFDPPSNGGSNITGYDYTLDNGATVTSFTISGFPSVTIQNLTNGTQYSVKLRARNAIGPGDWSAAATGTPTAPPPRPSAPTIDSATTDGTKITVKASGLVAGASIAARVYDSAFVAGGQNAFVYLPSPVVATISGGVAIFDITEYRRGATSNSAVAVSIVPTETYRVSLSQSNSAGSSSPTELFNVTRATTDNAAATTTTTTPVASAAPTTAAPTTTVVANVFSNAVPGITVTDTRIYTQAPVEVAASSAINVLTAAQNRVMDVQTKTPAVCLPNDDELVFIDEGRCIAEVINTKTRTVLRTLRTTVVEDEVSELKVGNEIVILAPIYFDTMSATLDAKAMGRLRSLKSRISAAGSVLLIGHSGTLNGNSPENIAISRARAESTLRALRSIGAKGPFAVNGVGALDPARTGKTQADQSKNRRVVIALIP